MNNALLFFYNINVSGLRKINNNYYFKYLNNNYGVYFYNRDPNDSLLLFRLNDELLRRGLLGYQILLTKNGNVLFDYEGKQYILMIFPEIENRLITYDDIISFNFEVNNYQKLDKSNWGYLWPNKLDFIEYQFNSMRNKFPIIEQYIDYYLGIWENAISYYNNVNRNIPKYVSHKRVYEGMDLYEFLNPLNFVIDYKERDIGEYIKSYVLTKNFSFRFFDKYFMHISRDSLIVLISRLLFPSYFFDIYERVVIDHEGETEILKVTKNSKNVLEVIKYLFTNYENYNIPYINWIKKED